MQSHFELTDHEFELQFEDATFDPALFSHEAHVRLAWIHLTKYGLEQAILNITSQLKRFVCLLGMSSKYNATVTVAAIKAVHFFMSKSGTTNFKDFITENPRLITSFKELLGHHYTTDIFTSDMAKENFLEPELLPFEEEDV